MKRALATLHQDGEAFPKKRLLVALAAAAVVFGAVYAVAASLNLTTDTLGAGTATVALRARPRRGLTWRPSSTLWLGPLAAVAVGAASSVALMTDSLGANAMAVPRCTAAGLSLIENLSGSNAVSVTVGNLPAGCAGATLSLTLNNGSASSSGSATVPAGGGTATVILAAGVAVTSGEESDLVMAGP